MLRSLSWRVAIDETEISGDIGRYQILAQGQRLPTQMYSLSYGDVVTAWDRPKPIKLLAILACWDIPLSKSADWGRICYHCPPPAALCTLCALSSLTRAQPSRIRAEPLTVDSQCEGG